jgi:hypothetical protein
MRAGQSAGGYSASYWPTDVCLKAGYQRWNAPIRSSLSTRVRTCEQEVGTARRPPYLLLLHHAHAHDLIDRRLDEGVGDRLPMAIALRSWGSRWRWRGCSRRTRPPLSAASAALGQLPRCPGRSPGPRPLGSRIEKFSGRQLSKVLLEGNWRLCDSEPRLWAEPAGMQCQSVKHHEG